MSKTYEVHCCKLCYEYGGTAEELSHISAGDESWDVCPSCQSIEQGSIDLIVDVNGKVVEVS